MEPVQLGTDVFLLFFAGALATIATLVWEFVIGAASDERKANSEDIEDLKGRVKSAEQACAKAERLESRVGENEERSKQTQSDLEELMRYLLGTNQPGDEGAIRGMHNSIEEVRDDVRDLNNQNEQIGREVKGVARTNTDIAYSFHELVDAMQQIDGVDAPDIRVRDEFDDRDYRRPDGGLRDDALGPDRAPGSDDDDLPDGDFYRGGGTGNPNSLPELPEPLEERLDECQDDEDRDADD